MSRRFVDRHTVSPAERALLLDICRLVIDTGGMTLTIGTEGAWLRLDTEGEMYGRTVVLGSVGSEEALHGIIYHLRKERNAA